jgi:hypothetical protein
MTERFVPARSVAPLLVLALAAMVACSSAGGGGSPEAGATPIAWTPGRYLLEATVGSTLSAEDFTGELTIRSADSMTLSASSGQCQPPTPAEAQRDRAAGVRSFACGSARWVVRPVPGGVRGEIRASILEEYRTQIACAPQQQPPCYIMETRQVSRSANLRVSPMP